MPITFFYLILSCVGITFTSEVHYIITPSQSQSCADQYSSTSSSSACVDITPTLSQFIENSSCYLTNDTRLIFSPGTYSLESELVIENVHSFSMFAWPASSSKAVITCGHNAGFEFRNVGIVTVSGLEFVGCFENHVVSVGQFLLENSGFLGGGQATVNSSILIIENSVANLDRTTFLSTIRTLKNRTEVTDNCTTTTLNNDRVIGILLRSSNIEITQSWFEGNSIGLGAVIYDELDSNVKIVNTTFIKNSASTSSDCNTTGSIVYVNNHRSSIKVYNSKFVQNVGVLIFVGSGNMLITDTVFIDNRNSTNFMYIDDKFSPSVIGYPLLIITNGIVTKIEQSKFTNNTGLILRATDTDVSISHSQFVSNNEIMITSCGSITNIDHSNFINNIGSVVLHAENTTVSISYSEFVGNNGGVLMHILHGKVSSIDRCSFINNTELWNMLFVSNTSMVSIVRSEFVNNTLTYHSPSFYDDLLIAFVILDAVKVTLSSSEFTNNIAGNQALVEIPYHTTAEGIANNVFIDNSAVYNILLHSDCRPGLSLSLGSSRCIQCSENWVEVLIGIVILNIIAGIALVIFMLALNMTVAVGTLNGILFYANIVAANADTYFLPFTAPNFITVFISWLNLEIGFDICIYDGTDYIIKGAIQFVFFPIYIILLVIIVVVASECSSKFAKIVSKLGNPVSVLATMILFSYAKLSTLLITYFSIVYGYPAYGSSEVNYDATMIGDIFVRLTSTQKSTGVMAVLLLMMIPIFILYVIFTVLVFSWQWLLRYQDKAIFKWVRYQKLRHLLEPYHAPYAAKYRYWTGLLLVVRILLYLISFVNFSLDPRVDLMAIIFLVGGLILLKGVIAKRVYKNWPLDVMETAIYFNLVAFSALTWYSLDFGGNQVAVAYTSIMIIFILLLGVIVFHALRYTRLYKCSFVEKALKWISSKLVEEKQKEQSPDDAPEELDGYQLERFLAGDQELPYMTYSVVEMSQPYQNQEEEN